jgi:hypothetical protein
MGFAGGGYPAGHAGERRRFVYVELSEYASLPAHTVASVTHRLEAENLSVCMARSRAEHPGFRGRYCAAVGPKIYCLYEVKHGG